MMKRQRLARAIWWSVAATLIAAPLALWTATSTAQAQFWQWPWEQDSGARQQRPAPRAPSQQQPTAPGYNNSAQFDPQGRPPICLQLEQRLAEEANRGTHGRSQLPEIEQGIQDAQRKVRRSERDLNRRECYEQFLFTKSLRRTRTCIQLDREARESTRELESLIARRQQILGKGDRSYQDDIIRELAQNNCGGVYQQEARRRNPFTNFWQDEDPGERDRIRGNTFAGLPFATYRTVCVRLCDGFYFPVSFSTLPTHFGRDANVCQSQCAAPTELYFHQNPGQAVEQMVSQRTQEPYTDLKTAFRYRKEYVAGCSCKVSEYVPDTGNATAQAQTEQQSGTAASAKPADARRQFSPIR